MSTEFDEDSGTIIQRVQMPETSGVDAIEARLAVVQMVPPKTEVRFYAVRGEDRSQLTTAEATALLRAHFAAKSPGDMSRVELLAEVVVLRAEAARMRPVYEAAKRWHHELQLSLDKKRLENALDDAVATAEDEEKTSI